MCVWKHDCSGEKRFCEVQWKRNETLVRLGLLQILRSNEAANVQSIAETLALNTARLHDYQNSYQQILVIATGSVFRSFSDLINLSLIALVRDLSRRYYVIINPGFVRNLNFMHWAFLLINIVDYSN